MSTSNHQNHPLAVEAEGITRALPLDGQMIPILNGITFSIARGAWVALTGPSGSGKSTLLGIVAGLDSPSGGRLKLDGVDVTEMRESELARIRNEKVGMVFQSFNLIPTLTAQENVEVPLYVSRDSRNAGARAREMLRLVGLDDRWNHRPNQLSGGQQQRVAIARALINRPALLIADEPTGNLDSRTGAAVLDLFARLREELEVTVIVATHDPQVAAYADREMHIVDGYLTANGASSGVVAQPVSAAGWAQ